MTAPKKRRAISRVDQPSTRTHGWVVRVGYTEHAPGRYRAKAKKFFGDHGHGGKVKALAAATAWRDGQEV